MHFDLDNSIARAEQQAMPWDFVITVNGVGYPTRPLTLAELGQLNLIGTMTLDQQRELVGSLFVASPALRILDWTHEQIAGAALAIAVYFRERVKKKSQRLAADVVAAVEQAASPMTVSTS